ncbi:Vms1/Ankzf1 family peptidyl-tRNA hydrolase [Haloprofundus salinisoli]|uniref:Vms1/Ankzf1 family peptidyl-tRNA hydrolase n=1 Tax=Haloprofundus salinisoli TaxID=2876193 RepID=UPI001CCAB7B1|nr:Vms1/Ankzf1 family peptidyl-tRNA hydrolase [Haloprofundus salinisoli]
MLDELLGRAELKRRIEELEEENHHLERRAAAEEERRADAVTARQEAEERVNRLEDRIAELDDRVDRLQDDGDEDVDFRGTETLRGARLDEILDRLGSFETGPEGALTAMVDGDSLPEAVEDAFGERAALVRRAAPCLIYTDDADLVSAALSPPRPPEAFCEWGESLRVDESWFRPTGRFAFAVARADLFALGEYDGRQRLEERGFESDVKEKHSKGGFSQARFERIRDGQIAEHVEKCREAIEDSDAETTILVGDREVVRELRDAVDATATSDAGGSPEEALEEGFRDFWTTRLSLV